jgi:hypothetical protein
MAVWTLGTRTYEVVYSVAPVAGKRHRKRANERITFAGASLEASMLTPTPGRKLKWNLPLSRKKVHPPLLFRGKSQPSSGQARLPCPGQLAK